MKIFKHIIKLALIFLTCFILCVMGIWLTAKIPVDLVKENAIQSSHTIVADMSETNPNPFPIWKGVAFTDSIMINIVSTQDNNKPFYAAFVATQKVREETEESLSYPQGCIDYLEENTEYVKECSYRRYWHGYMVYLKPLLIFFNYRDLLWMGLILGSGLLITLTYIIYKSYGCALAIAFLFTQLAFQMLRFSVSLVDAPCLIISYIASLVVIISMKRGYLYSYSSQSILFFIIGIITCYMDFLRAPLLTIAFPLIFILLSTFKTDVLKESIIRILLISVSWSSGYAGIWIAKWVCNYWIANGPIIEAGSLMYRSIGGIAVSEKILVRVYVIIAAAILYLGAIATSIWYGTKKRLVNFHKIASLLILSFYPFAWSLVSLNHTAVHPWISHKNFSITLFAWLIIFIFIVKKEIRLTNK